MTTVHAVARSWLFVPGDRPDRFAKAAASGADVVILDLEDAVGPDAKDAARATVAEWLSARADVERWAVRINAADTPWCEDDVEALASWSGTLVVPKAEDPDRLGLVVRRRPSGAGVVALVETAAGVLAAARVASIPGIVRLAFGSFDLAAELAVDPADRTAMLHARQHLVLASAAAGLVQPIDGVTGAVDDPTRLDDDLAHARSLGFGGKLCIHPRQVPAVRERWQPSPQELAWAKDVLAAAALAAGGATVVHGQLVDKPVTARAEAIIAAGAAADAAPSSPSSTEDLK